MTRVQEILTSVRDVLADQKKLRWSDENLIRLFNEGLSNFILQAKTLKLRSYIELENSTALYNLSAYVVSIDRVQYLDRVLESKTEEDMDKLDLTWQSKTGAEPKYIIFDNLQKGIFRIFPRLDNSGLNNIEQNQLYGVLIDIEVNEDLYRIPSFNNAAFESSKYMVIYYTGKPRKVYLESSDDEIDLDSLYDQAMIAYISGQALRYDADTLNRNFGAEQLSIYKSYVDQAKAKEAEANNTFIRREISYKGFV